MFMFSKKMSHSYYGICVVTDHSKVSPHRNVTRKWIEILFGRTMNVQERTLICGIKTVSSESHNLKER